MQTPNRVNSVPADAGLIKRNKTKHYCFNLNKEQKYVSVSIFLTYFPIQTPFFAKVAGIHSHIK